MQITPWVLRSLPQCVKFKRRKLKAFRNFALCIEYFVQTECKRSRSNVPVSSTKCLTRNTRRSCSSLHFHYRWCFPSPLSTNVSSSYGRRWEIHDRWILQSKSWGPLCYLSFWGQALLQDNHSQVNYQCSILAWIMTSDEVVETSVISIDIYDLQMNNHTIARPTPACSKTYLYVMLDKTSLHFIHSF